MSKFKSVFGGLSLAIAFCCYSQIGLGQKKPNIIYIMSDDHTSQAIGIYGGALASVNPTPVIDEFAKEGMVFENAFCTNSICTPSRANVMTGQYSQTNGVLDLDGNLPPERQYLPIEMKKLGYQTAMIGKWHLKQEPAAFDYYNVLPGQGNYFDPSFRVSTEGAWPNNMESHKGYVSDIITDVTLEYLEKRDKNKPFFLMHHHKAPHDDFEYPERYQPYLSDVEIPEPASMYAQPFFGSEATLGRNNTLRDRIGTSVSSRHPYRNYSHQYGLDSIANQDERTHQAYQEYTKRYLRCVKGVDDNLGRLFKYLKENDLWDNTIIVYTSDQGMMLGEHDYMDKRWMYEESMRMPFIIKYPKLIKPNSRTKAIINNTDYAPTLLELAGGEVPSYMQGESFKEVLTNPTKDFRDATYYRYWMHLTHHDVPAHFGVRTAKSKLIFYYGAHYNTELYGKNSFTWVKDPSESYHFEPTPAAWEFYDLTLDPKEVVNRYKDPKYQAEIQKLKAEILAQRLKYKEEDKAYPNIESVIEAHWND
ncbi:sulfatase [uncultured Arcticibacterium sp.]|uniref:sulfatase family protein n=1 Tax=uncultured Arcticibacterium sp. TaxID=2173042 RepID=UPI0030F76F69